MKIKKFEVSKSKNIEYNYELFKTWLERHREENIYVENVVMNSKKIKTGQWLLDNYLGLDMWLVVYESKSNNEMYDYSVIIK